MTDEEVIMIDGVNVVACFHYVKDSKEYSCGLSNCPFHYRFCEENPKCYYKQLQRKEQECERLKIQLMHKDEVNMFFNTPVEGWSNDPCEICPYKQEYKRL